MIIIDLINSDGTGRRLRAKTRGLLVHVFDEYVSIQEPKRAVLIVDSKYGLNRYVIGVEKIRKFLRTGDTSLYSTWNKGDKRSDRVIKKLYER